MDKKTQTNAANQGGKWIRPDKRLAIYLRDGLGCAYCGATMEMEDILLTLDHVVPQSLGGENKSSNLVCCCKSCNSAKQDKSLRDFLSYLADEKGVDVTDIPRQIRNRTRRSITKWRRIAKAVIKARRVKK